MKTEKEFVTALTKSTNAVSAVASYLARQGLQVLIKPTLVAPSFEQRHDYADDGDIEVRQRIEVKHRTVSFTCRDDYPFETVIVDEQFKIDRIPVNHLWAYIILNREQTHLCVIKSSTRKKWQAIEKYDSKEKEHRRFYACPKQFCMFLALERERED